VMAELLYIWKRRLYPGLDGVRRFELEIKRLGYSSARKL
jgi:hypothetical protein